MWYIDRIMSGVLQIIRGSKEHKMDQKLKDRSGQYSLMAAIVKQMYEELGKEEALQIVKRGLNKLAVQTAKEWAKEAGGNSLKHLAEFCRKGASRPDSGTEVVEITDKHIAMKINRCVGFEAMDYLGLGDVCRLYCDSDHILIKAFNPKMKLVRTKTVATGDECCNHIWALEE